MAIGVRGSPGLISASLLAGRRCEPQLESGHHSPQLEEAWKQQQRPITAKNEKKKVITIKTVQTHQFSYKLLPYIPFVLLLLYFTVHCKY